jgi:hypothetical protein
LDQDRELEQASDQDQGDYDSAEDDFDSDGDFGDDSLDV